MKRQVGKNRDIARRTAFGAIFAATATVLLILGGLIEILDMTCAAVASAAVLVMYVEFGTKTALAVYAVSSCISLIIFPTATSVIYYALLLGYYPVFKFFVDRKLKEHKILKKILKFLVFNVGCALILLLFSIIYGFAKVISEFEFGFVTGKTVMASLFVMLNFFLVMYDMLLNSLVVIYIKVLRKRIFPKK